jgi:hypothetical protein
MLVDGMDGASSNATLTLARSFGRSVVMLSLFGIHQYEVMRQTKTDQTNEIMTVTVEVTVVINKQRAE